MGVWEYGSMGVWECTGNLITTQAGRQLCCKLLIEFSHSHTPILALVFRLRTRTCACAVNGFLLFLQKIIKPVKIAAVGNTGS